MSHRGHIIVTAKLEVKSKERKEDLINLLILLSIAAIIGVYLISTSALIAQDGVFYIEQAQRLPGEAAKITKEHPPGYPFLIFAAHKIVMLFNNNSSASSWAYIAQSVTLLCRLLALIPLYFIGKFLVGGKNGFWGLLILIILPYPAKVGSDALRDWPYILFLSTGFLLLLWSIKSGKWWEFALVGLVAGCGYWIRPISIQLFLYVFAVIVIRFVRNKRDFVRSNTAWGVILLFTLFAVFAGIYIKSDNSFLVKKAHNIIEVANTAAQNSTEEPGLGITVTNLVKSLWHIMRIISENLMWFFVPALCVGFYHHFKHNTLSNERILLITFISINMLLLVIRYCCFETALSRRYAMPMIAITISYVPIGLHIIGEWLSSKFTKKQLQTIRYSKTQFFVLLLIGISICLPKLVRPMRIEKKGYRIAAEWLRENTDQEDIIAVRDSRISFYAERKRVGYDVSDHNRIIFHEERDNQVFKIEAVPAYVKYIVRKTKNKDEILDYGRGVQEVFSSWNNDNQMKYRIIIYKVL